MKALISLIAAFFLFCSATAQNSDLIVTTDGDSIACKIMEVNEVGILFKMKNDNRQQKTTIPAKEIKQLEYNVVKAGMYRYEEGSSRIAGIIDISPQRKYYPLSSRCYALESLQKASADDIEYLNGKALKLQKTGKTMIFIGVGAMIFGAILYIDGISREGWDGLGEAVLGVGATVSGLASTGLGIIVKRNGTRRVEAMRGFVLNQNHDITLELKPAIRFIPVSSDFYPAVSLYFSF